MKTFFTKKFKKNYIRRISPNKNLDKRFTKRYLLFVQNPQNKILEDHPLSGKMKGFRAISITGGLRAIYYVHDDIVYFVDIGIHNQVYY